MVLCTTVHSLLLLAAVLTPTGMPDTAYPWSGLSQLSWNGLVCRLWPWPPKALLGLTTPGSPFDHAP